MTDTTPDYIAEAIIEAFGERCPDFAEGCFCCEAWKEYDTLLERNAALERELEMWREVKHSSHWKARAKALADKYCEGWCKESGGQGKFDDCVGCEILSALTAGGGDE